ncbi:Si-specific NAD(P)(+) transhydrogenase [Halalkalibaculum sp. DA3122]|uniref:Si-specific NAD(P)(+) transhydrogenase n=1 Tax=unclassified Halalkalibaculum TaxID=2964617 RepID=UPI0037546205
MSHEYDVIIVGSGPAGYSCAMQSSKFDKKVLVVEAHDSNLGGTWINLGTVPSKALRESANTIKKFDTQFGTRETRKPYERFRMEDLLQYKNAVLEQENKKVKNDLIKNEVDVARGFGRIAGEHTVEVETPIGTTERYSADRILLCTGSSPVYPTSFEIDHDKVLDYKSIFGLTHIPKRLAIIGIGVNALEYATTFAALGTRVTMLSEDQEHLTFLDEEIQDHLDQALADQSITIKKGVQVESIEYNSIRTCVEVRFRKLQGDDRLQVIETEHALYMGGSKPNTADIGLDKVQIEIDDEGYIPVDDTYKTKIDSIYAAGDIIGFPRLASASFTQGRLAACNMFDIPAKDIPQQIPFGIYTLPEMSHIGLTEQQAIDEGIDVTVGRAYFKNIAKADMMGDPRGILKLVFSTDSFKLLGVHILGDQACNLIHLGQSVMAFDGDIRYFIRNVMNYPTLSEAYRRAAFNGVNRVYKAGVKYKKILENGG